MLGQTVAERVFVSQLEFWDASFAAQRSVPHFRQQTNLQKDIVVHVVSLRDKFFPKALDKQVRPPSPAGIFVCARVLMSGYVHCVDTPGVPD